MSGQPLTFLTMSCFFYGIFCMISDQIYVHYKQQLDYDNHGEAYCFLDNFFYGWYYRLATVTYLVTGGILMYPNVSMNEKVSSSNFMNQ